MTIGQKLSDYRPRQLGGGRPRYTPSGLDEFVPPEQLVEEQRREPARYNVLEAAAGRNPWEEPAAAPVEPSAFDPQGSGQVGLPVTDTDPLERLDRATAVEDPAKSVFATEMRAAIEASRADPDRSQPLQAEQTFRDADATIVAVEPDGNLVWLPEAVQDALPDPVTCDVCTAAKLAESGIMPTSVPPSELHAKCRAPGTCTCGCEFSEGGRCANCGRNRLAGELVEGVCDDKTGCAEAMLTSRPATSAAVPTSKAPARTPRPRSSASKSAPRPCADGCGEMTGGGMYKPGHDSKHVKTLVAAVRAGGVTRQHAIEQLPTDALRGKLQKQLGEEI